jgi:gluconolactonase
MAHAGAARPRFKTSDFRVVASGLNCPEGPCYCPADGTVLVCEIGAGQLTRVHPDTGQKDVVAKLGGGPNGAAIGPDGAVYVCNDGGFFMINVPQKDGGNIQGAVSQPPNYVGGSIQRVAADGTFTTLYTQFTATNPMTNQPQTLPLRSPDDLVFDSHGGFWFTDWGKDRWRDRDITGVYYAKPDGSSIQEMLFPLQSPNGIALSPDEGRVYVAETWTRRIRYWKLSGPGKIDMNPDTLDGSYLLTAHIPYQAGLDSMSMDEQGNLYAISILPQGWNANTRGAVTVVSPDGEILDWIEIDIGQQDPLPSNICFGGPDRRTAYITMGGTGRLIACEMLVPGKKPAYE